MFRLVCLCSSAAQVRQFSGALEVVGTPAEAVSMVSAGEVDPLRDLPLTASDALGGAKRGAATGAILGALAACAVVGSGGLLGAGLADVGLFGAGAGTTYGLLAGLVTGSANPKPEVDKALSLLQAGHTLLCIRSEDRRTVELARETLESLGASFLD